MKDKYLYVAWEEPEESEEEEKTDDEDLPRISVG